MIGGACAEIFCQFV